MKFNNHWQLTGKHAFLSASNPSWLNYNPEKLRTSYLNNKKKEHGTYLHDLASRLINERIKVADFNKTFNQFVNDCIGFGLSSEVLLYYSDNCFGTADAIKFDEKTRTLFVFDLKTGDGKPKPQQLLIYSALFCLEYGKRPKGMTFITRFYQGNGFDEILIDPEEVSLCMKKIKELDKELWDVKEGLEM